MNACTANPETYYLQGCTTCFDALATLTPYWSSKKAALSVANVAVTDNLMADLSSPSPWKDYALLLAPILVALGGMGVGIGVAATTDKDEEDSTDSPREEDGYVK